MTDIYRLDTKLAIIGFDAQLPGLDSIDQVAAALYKDALADADCDGDSDAGPFNDYWAVCKSAASRVLETNKLGEQDVAVVIVCASEEMPADATSGHFSCFFACRQVTDLAAALRLSESLINEAQMAVLVIAANINAPSGAQQSASISFADDFTGYGSSNGVCCLLLASQPFATAHHCYQYATINALSSHTLSSTAPIGRTISKVIKHALSCAGISRAQISSLEVSALGTDRLAELEAQALLSGYQNGTRLNTSLSCCKSVLGENGALSQLFGLLNCVLALQQRYRPAIKHWTSPVQALLPQWLSSPFYLFNQAVSVFPKADKSSARYMAYSCLSENHYSHLILQENNDNLIHTNGFNATTALSLFIIADNSEAGLLKQLVRLVDKVATLTDKAACKALAGSLYLGYQSRPDRVYKLVLLAESVTELAQELQRALSGVQQAFSHANSKNNGKICAKNSAWKTPKGSFFTAQPMAGMTSPGGEKVGFIYPGIGASYLGLGRDLLQLFPDVYPAIIALADDINESLQDRLINPRSVCALDFAQRKQRELALRSELSDSAECGVGYACLFTKIVEQVFTIKAGFAAGYSMGEVSMFAALGCWQHPGQMSQRLANSPTFKQRLAGELRGVREHWQLPVKLDGQPVWESYSIKASARQVKKVLKETDRVYITLINTADSLVIAGYPDDCLAVCARLSVRALPLHIANAIHCPPAYGEYQPMCDLYQMALAKKISCKLYSSSCYLPIPQHSKAIAVSISQCLCEPVDFPRLMNTLYQAGCRVFIEMGAGSSLTSWTDKILRQAQQTDYLAVAMNSKGVNDQLTFARAAAKLLSVGVDINVHSFFHGTIIQSAGIQPAGIQPAC